MQFKQRKFAAIVADKFLYFTLMGAVGGIGSMIRPGPGPDEYILRWDASKIALSTSIGVALGVFVGVLEARRWLKSYWETIHTLAEEGKDPAAVYPPARPRTRTPFWP